jgi:hypothetical protein
MMDKKSFYTVEGNEGQQYFESEDPPATEDVKCILMIKLPA